MAVSLIRQCIEAITVMELGLIENKIGEKLINDWRGGMKQGTLRGHLEEQVWSEYGDGIWEEAWPKYFASLAGAVQDYSHYSPALQGWQMIVDDEAHLKEMSDGMLMAKLRYGFDTYDAGKAIRITLLHILIGWTIGRIAEANGYSSEANSQALAHLRESLADSSILAFAKHDWAHQFWPLEFEDIDPYST